MKGLHLALRIARLGGGREAFADGLALDLAGETAVGAVARLVGLMTMAVWFSATAMNSGDRAATEITQLQELAEQSGTRLFEGGEGLRQTASHQGVSADGKSITVNVKGTDFQGKRRDAVAVYDKQ